MITMSEEEKNRRIALGEDEHGIPVHIVLPEGEPVELTELAQLAEKLADQNMKLNYNQYTIIISWLRHKDRRLNSIIISRIIEMISEEAFIPTGLSDIDDLYTDMCESKALSIKIPFDEIKLRFPKKTT